MAPTRRYALTNGVILLMALLAATHRIPFTRGFEPIAVPYLAALLSLPWLFVSRRIVWRLALFVLSFASSAALLLWCLSPNSDMANVSSSIVALAVAFFFLYKFLVPYPRMKSAAGAQILCVTYAAAMWTFLQYKGITAHFISTSRFEFDALLLFWPSFIAAGIWALSRCSGWRRTLLLCLVIAVLQPAIGFADMARIWHVPWANGASFICVLLGLGLAIFVLLDYRVEHAQIANRVP